MRKLKVKLKTQEKRLIEDLLNKGENSARVIKRGQILKLLNEGYSSNKISVILGVTPETARRTGWKYLNYGLSRAIEEPSRPGKERVLNERGASQIIAIACSKPPEGRERWTLELLVKEAIKKKIVKKVGRETIRVLLKSHDFKPWREKNVVYW